MTFSTLASPGVSLQGGSGSGGGSASLPISGDGATITASTPLVSGTQTWNNSGVTFTSLLLNVTDTLSASGSLLMDLQIGASSKFSVNKSGAVNTSSSVTGTGFVVTSGGSSVVQVSSLATYGYHMASGYSVTWGSNATLNGSIDLILTRRAAANLRLGAADVGATTATVTITIATPGVVTWTGHTLSTGTPVVFTTTGALPTGITSGTTYYAVVVDTNTFQLASSVANAIAATPTVITTSGTQSGTHTGTRYNITQRLSMQSITGVTDRLGADLFIQGSQGTGTGAGGSIIFQVAPAGGTGTAQNALATALTIGQSDISLTLASSRYFIINDRSGNNTGLWVQASTGGIGLASGGYLLWSNSATNSFGTTDLALLRDASNTLAQRNATAAQRFNVYNTWTSSTNYEAFKIDWITTANTVLVGTEKGSGGGTARALEFQTDGTTRLTIASNGSTTLAGFTTVSGGSIRLGNSDGDITLSSGVIYVPATTRFAIGGTSASFPALKRSTTFLQVVLANDTGFTNIQGKLTTDTAYTAGDPATTGYLVVYDSTGTAYKIPALAV